MKKGIAIIVFLSFGALSFASTENHEETASQSAYQPQVGVKVGGFWGEKYKMLVCKWIPHCIRQMEKGGEGEWSDPLSTWYSLMTHPEWHARLKKVKSHHETFRTDLKPGEAIVLYRSDEGYYARTNTTSRAISASVTLKGTSVLFEMNGAKEGPLPINPLCDQKKINRFNGLMVGTFWASKE